MNAPIMISLSKVVNPQDEPGGESAVLQRLSAAFKLRTVTQELAADDTSREFEALREGLRAWFPHTHQVLERNIVGDRGALHYVWHGSDPGLQPWLFISHQDVVDAPESADGAWLHPPFSGAIADGYVWGRGAMDLKVSILAVMEAIELLLAEGHLPRRSLHLAFGADEETGGHNGAALIAHELRRSGIRFAFSLDEGGVVSTGVLPGVEKPVAVIGIAEKGYLTVRLTCSDGGGHSSMPEHNSPLERLLRLLHRIAHATPRARLDGPTLALLRALAPVARWPHCWIYRWARFATQLLLPTFRKSAAANASIRTTLALTGISAGGTENVIPNEATATVNFRLKPGDKIEEILAPLRRLSDRYGAKVETFESREASPVSDPGAPAFSALVSAIGAVMPDVVCAPCLTLNGTDSRHYEDIVRNQFRFLPVRAKPEDLKRIHGTNERIAIANYAEMIEIYAELIRRVDNLPD